MAIVIRYFSTTAAGDGLGLDWDNRAALFDGSNLWSTVITSYDFAANGNSMLCYIESGSYTCAETLIAGAFTTDGGTAPTVANLLILHGCDASGNPLTPPDPDWVSAQGAYDYSNFPSINAGSFNQISLNGCVCRFLVWINTSNTTGFNSAQLCDWVVHITSGYAGNTSVGGFSSGVRHKTNCISDQSGCTSQYARGFSSAFGGVTDNCLAIGRASASAGSGFGVAGNISGFIQFSRCTAINHPTAGILLTSTNTGQLSSVVGCTVVGNAVGILGSATGGQTIAHAISGCVVVNSSDYGINADASSFVVQSSRLRNNTIGNFNGLGNYPDSLDNDVSDGDDTEFVNAAIGDYRIAASSSLWGKGYGAGDEIPTPATVAAAIWARSGRKLTA